MPAGDAAGPAETAIDILISEADIATRIESLAGEIADDILGEFLVVVVLKGSFVFAADLIRALDRAGASPQVEFIMLSSYGEGAESAGRVRLEHDVSEDIAGRRILLIDDILESGRTIAFAREMLLERGAEQVRTCLLLDKPGARKIDIEADYVGFRIGREFVVGYG
ncbi:MAG: phosphoribosyltransferase, partial [Alphaproteobacteria bacterium]